MEDHQLLRPERLRVLRLGQNTANLSDNDAPADPEIPGGRPPHAYHDLDRCPWPFPSDHFDEIHAQYTLSHSKNPESLLDEMHRICRDRALIKITDCHFSTGRAYSDLRRRRSFSYSGFLPIDAPNSIGPRVLSIPHKLRWVGSQILFGEGILDRLAGRLANFRPLSYERRWWRAFPAGGLYIELQVLKAEAGPGE